MPIDLSDIAINTILISYTKGTYLKLPEAWIISISLFTPFAACSNVTWMVASSAPPKPNGEKSSKGENPPLLLLDDSPKPFANSPKIFRNSSSGFTFAYVDCNMLDE